MTILARNAANLLRQLRVSRITTSILMKIALIVLIFVALVIEISLAAVLILPALVLRALSSIQA